MANLSLFYEQIFIKCYGLPGTALGLQDWVSELGSPRSLPHGVCILTGQWQGL